MNGPRWILCEDTGRWAAALRMWLDREPLQPEPRLYEVRSLAELSTRLATRPDSMALVEVSRINLADVLDFLVDAVQRFPAARFAALLDGDLTHSASGRQQAIAALYEAGVCEIATSPRQLRGVLTLMRRHAERAAARQSPGADNLPIEAWAWASLPWQAD